MKKLLLITALLAYGATTANAQQIDTLYYDSNWKGVEQAAFAEFYRVTYTAQNSNYANKFKSYYMSGELRGEGEFINIDRYDDSKSAFTGEVRVYFKNGNVEFIMPYQNGVLNGTQTEFYENGKAKAVGTIKDGVFDGEYKEYYEDGTIKVISNLKEGKSHGQIDLYHPNGKLSNSIQYLNDKPNGIAKVYDETGNLMQIIDMIDGVANGKMREMYPNGFFIEYAINNDTPDYSKIDLYDPTEKFIISYNATNNMEPIGIQTPSKADIQVMRMGDDNIIQYYDINALKIGAVLIYEMNNKVSAKKKSYRISVYFENWGLVPVTCFFSDVKIEYLKKSKPTLATACNPQAIYDSYAHDVRVALGTKYRIARETAQSAATVSTHGSNTQYSSSSSFGNISGRSGTIAGAVNNYGGSVIGASASRGTVSGYGSEFGVQRGNTSERTVDGLLQYQILQEETGKVDEEKQQYENQLNEIANSIYYNFTVESQQSQWRSLLLDFQKADILRVTLLINDIPYVFEWDVKDNK